MNVQAARSGNAISFAFFAWLLQWAAPSKGSIGVDTSWRWVFRASGVIQLVPLIMLSYFGRKGKRDNMLKKDGQSNNISKTSLKVSLDILFLQSRTLEFWLHLISRSIIMVLVSFLLFIPSYMAQCFEMSSASSARVGSMFALGCLLSVTTLAERTYPSTAANFKTGGSKSITLYRRKAFSMLAFLTLSTASLVFQSFFLKGWLSLSPLIGTLLMFLFGFSLGKIDSALLLASNYLKSCC